MAENERALQVRVPAVHRSMEFLQRASSTTCRFISVQNLEIISLLSWKSNQKGNAEEMPLDDG